MMQFHTLIREHSQELAELIVKENGKNITEALADGKDLGTSVSRMARPALLGYRTHIFFILLWL